MIIAKVRRGDPALEAVPMPPLMQGRIGPPVPSPAQLTISPAPQRQAGHQSDRAGLGDYVLYKRAQHEQ